MLNWEEDFEASKEKELPELGKKRKKDLLNETVGSVRVNIGRYLVNEEYEKYRKKILSQKLP